MITIPRILAKLYNKPEYKSIYQEASDSNKLFMVILDKNEYSKIEYDLESIKPLVTMSSKTNEAIISMYEEYLESSKIDTTDFSYAGSNRNLIMKVKKSDAETLAIKLYGFINENLELMYS